MDNLLAFATSILNSSNLGTIVNFKIILLSIVIEALPFVLFSVLVSAILNNFVSEDTIRKIIPRSKFLSILPASLLGVLFPVCDCGMVPIVRRLVMKGVPLPAAVAFMLAARSLIRLSQLPLHLLSKRTAIWFSSAWGQPSLSPA